MPNSLTPWLCGRMGKDRRPCSATALDSNTKWLSMGQQGLSPLKLFSLSTPQRSKQSISGGPSSFQPLSIVSIVPRFYQRFCPALLEAFPFPPPLLPGSLFVSLVFLPLPVDQLHSDFSKSPPGPFQPSELALPHWVHTYGSDPQGLVYLLRAHRCTRLPIR